ncbi:MAG: glycosyltransferase [Bdellovibrionales bacterium]
MILMYHKVALTAPTIWWLTADVFDRQLAALQAYDVVYLSDYDPGNPRHVVISFDGIYDNVYDVAFPLLKKYGYPFELFVIGDYIGGDNAFDSVEPLTKFATLEQLQEMTKGGARLQWHSKTHQRMKGMDEKALRAEIELPAGLRKAFPAPHFDWFGYPHGDHDDLAVRIVKENYKGALSSSMPDDNTGIVRYTPNPDADRYRLDRVTCFANTKLSKSKVSVIIANYNYGAYLPQAVESVLAQTMPPDEILIIDDCSTDNSHEIINRYRGNPRIRIELNAENLGIVGNFNKAVGLTSGDYVAFLGADNRMRIDYVEKCKAVLDAHEKVGVAYTDMTIFGPLAKPLAERQGAKLIGQSRTENWPVYLWEFPEPTEQAIANLKNENFMHGSSMYRRAAFDQVGGYRKDKAAEDHNLFHRMVDAGWLPMHVPHALIEYRQHSLAQANTVLIMQLEANYWRRMAMNLAAKNQTYDALFKKLAATPEGNRLLTAALQSKSA